MSDRNERARAALRGEWLPGMRVLVDGTPGRLNEHWGGMSWSAERGSGWFAVFPPPPGTWDCVPDLDDRVTELALIAVIEARIGREIRIHAILGGGSAIPLGTGDSAPVVSGPTRKDALIAALEAT